MASMIALLKANNGSSSFIKHCGIFLISVSSPTHRKLFFLCMFSINSCRVIISTPFPFPPRGRAYIHSWFGAWLYWLLLIISYFLIRNYSLPSGRVGVGAVLEFCLLHPFCIFSHDEVVDAILYVAVHEGGKVVNGVANAVVGDAPLWIVVGANLC